MASRTVVLPPRPPKAICLAQKGMRTSTTSRQRQSSRLTTLPVTERPRLAAGVGEEDAHRRGEHDRLRDLDREGGGDRPPPELGEPFGLREEVAEQQQRRGADEDDDDRRPEQVEDHQRDRGDGAGEAEQGEEDAAVAERADDERLQRGGARGRARAVAEEGGGERVADLDQLAAEAEAGVDDDAGEERGGGRGP